MLASVTHENLPHPDALIHIVGDLGRLPVDLPEEAKAAINRPEFGSQSGAVASVFPASGPRIVVLGLGAPAKATVESVRKAGLKLAQHLASAEILTAHLTVDEAFDSIPFGQAVGVALATASFKNIQFGGSVQPVSSATHLKIKSISEQFDLGLARGIKIGESVNYARWLVNTPPNIATPGWIAEQAQSLGLNVTVLQGDDLKRENLVGLINVGQASVNPPCLIRLEWRPKGTEGQKPVVLLGKTITYDTGGLSIKGKTSMPGMKYDKSGGCAVLGTMKAIVEHLRPPFPVVGLLVAAENSISENAYRPDDIITYRNGVTVEITNTDAEGRLVLADGLCWACDNESPDCIIDIATLTGGVVTALGSEMAGVFSEDDQLFAEVALAGSESGEKIWRLPLNDAYRDMMKGSVSDIINSVIGGSAHPCQGAAFLSYFCKPEVPFAHIDMAGVSHCRKDEFGYEGPSGWGVRLFCQLLLNRMEAK